MQTYPLKFILVGDSCVGKSQLSRCYLRNEFHADSQTTVGLEFSTKTIEFEKCLIKAQIWDTAGQERFESMTKAYYRDALGAILVYDVCDKASFENLRDVWLKQAREYCQKDFRMILVGNKVDKVMKKENSGEEPPDRAVSIEEAKQFAEQENMDFIETSALTAFCVEKMFRRVFLSVARLLPEVSFHLDLTELPDGWLAQSSDEVVARSSTAHSRAHRHSIANGPRGSVNISSLSISSPRSSPKNPKSADHTERSSIDTICSYSTQSDNTNRTIDIYKTTYTNYWTGQTQDEAPSSPADPGLIYKVSDTPLTERDSFTDQTKQITRHSTLSTNDRSSISGKSSLDNGGTDDWLSDSKRSKSYSEREKKANCLSGRCNIT